jgi:hypothetical protein
MSRTFATKCWRWRIMNVPSPGVRASSPAATDICFKFMKSPTSLVLPRLAAGVDARAPGRAATLQSKMRAVGNSPEKASL